MNVPPGRRLEVWSDGEYAWLGYDDGRMFSLPSLNPLAPVLREPVVDY